MEQVQDTSPQAELNKFMEEQGKRIILVEMELDSFYQNWTLTEEQLVERLIAPTNAGVKLKLHKKANTP